MTIPEKLQRLKLSEKIPSNPPDEDDEPPPIPPTRPSTPPPPPAPTYPSNQLVVRPPTAPMWDAAVDVFEYPPSYHPRYQPTSVRMQPVMVQTQRGPVAMIPMHQQLPQPRAHYAVQTEQVTTIGTALGGAGHVVDVPRSRLSPSRTFYRRRGITPSRRRPSSRRLRRRDSRTRGSISARTTSFVIKKHSVAQLQEFLGQ